MLIALLAIDIPWSPNIVTIGGFLLTWHGLFTAIGILAGVQLSLRMARVTGFGVDQAYNAALVGVPAGILGARLLFVGENWDFYGAHPWQIFNIIKGGISIWGAVLGGITGGVAFALWRGYAIGRGLDTASFGLILGMAIGRLGDLVNGEHLARATDLPWAVYYTHPESPAFAHSLVVGPHHPATTYELLGDLAILGVLFWALRGPFRVRPGLTFFVFFVGYAVMRFFLTYLRVDSDEALGLRTPQLVSIVAVFVSLPAIAYFARRPRDAGSGLGAPPSPDGRARGGRGAGRRRR